jgi:hypothetical protein
MWRRLWLQTSSTGRKCPLRRSEFHEKNNDATVVVLAGSTHAWKPGIPAQVLERNYQQLLFFLRTETYIEEMLVLKKLIICGFGK